MKKLQKDECEMFLSWLKNRVPFSIARFADGERAFMEGRAITGIDGWQSPAGVGALGKALLDAYTIGLHNGTHLGISDPVNDKESNEYFLELTPKSKQFLLTMSNVFHNGTHETFLAAMEPIIDDYDAPVYLICSQDTVPQCLHYNFPDVIPLMVSRDCQNFW